MGYTAETDWHLAFTSHDAVSTCRAQLEAGVHGHSAWPRGWTFDLPPGLDPETAAGWLGNVGEHTTGDWTDRGPDTGPVLVGSTAGKYTLDEWAVDVLATHAQGTIDGRGEDGALWRVRLADGQATWHQGAVIYPSDKVGTTANPVHEALSAAILALNTLRHPEATAGDQWDWLDSTAEAHQHTLTGLRDWVDAQGEDLDLGGHRAERSRSTNLDQEQSQAVNEAAAHPGQASPPGDWLTLTITGITGHRDRDGVAERWAVTGRVDVLGVAHDFTYAYQNPGEYAGVDQDLTVTLDGIDQGYAGWQWGAPPPSSASLISRRVDHEWLVDVIRDASVQKVWDAHYDAEQGALRSISASTTHVALPGTPDGGGQRTATAPTSPAAPAAGPVGATRAAGARR
jgi:hypothetical protein